MFLAASVLLFLGTGGWSVYGAPAAYCAAGLAGILGVALMVGWPRVLSRNALAVVVIDSVLVSALVCDTGREGSLFLFLYLLASLGLIRTASLPVSFVGAAALAAGYLIATVATGLGGTFGAFFVPETAFGSGLVFLSGILAGLVGLRLQSLQDKAQKLSLADTSLRESEEQISVLFSSFAPALRVLDVGGILDWAAAASGRLLGAPFVHVALLDVVNHRTHAEGSSNVYPSWWHPGIQRLLLWSSRTGEILREETTVCGLKGFVAVPIPSSEDGGIGAIVVGGKTLNEREERILESLAAEISGVLEASKDAPGGRNPISGLPDKPSLRRILGREFSRGNATTLLTVRLDRLREYRRLYGDPAGDRLFEKLGSRLNVEYQRVFHCEDVLAVALKGSSGLAARRAALHIRKVVAASTNDAAVPQDASVGFVLLDSGETRDPDLILEAAFEAVSIAETASEKLFGASPDAVAEAIRERERGESGKRRDEIALALLETTRLRDSYLGPHMRAVSQLSLRVGSEMGFSRDSLDVLGIGALLHDVGKIGISDAILQKPGPLTGEEYEVMKSHVILGAEMVTRVADLAVAAPTVKHHHERFDGGGYPDGLVGEDIPLTARIVCATDALDSMMRDKAYQRGISLPSALDEILRNSGTQFDPRVAEALMAVSKKPGENRMGFAN